MRYIASTSFGADSTAQIIVAMENGEPLDDIVYCEVMFTSEISAEMPEHRDFIYNVAIPHFANVYGLKTTVLRAKTAMWDDFHRLRVRGRGKGTPRGFPIPGLCSVKRDCKLPPLNAYLKGIKEKYVQYVGIAADEVHRLKGLEGTNSVSLLAKYWITQRHAREIAAKHGLLSPIYEFAKRNGCFFCPNAGRRELTHLYTHHPDLWEMLRELQSTPNLSRRCFTRTETVFEVEERIKARL